MGDIPAGANVVVIGGGIVGNCVVGHLARLGWRDILQIDKGPFPNPGGSTGHASNFIFPVDHSKEMAQLTLDSTTQYKNMGVFTESGGVEVARTEERMEELRRRMASSHAWLIDSELVTTDRLLELVPYVNKDIIIGAFHSPGVGVVDSLRAGTLFREEATSLGALTIAAGTEVTGIDVLGGRIRGVRTNRGDVAADYVIIACGVWSPRIARMAGATIPLTPAVHQMISVGPIPLFEKTVGEIEYPIVRDMDVFMYERQNGSDMEVGSYAHRAILLDPDEIPSIEQAKLSPTELPFSEADFDPQMEDALELMPDILTVPGAGIRHAINGLLSLTPDGFPCLGETHEVQNLWSAAAVWIKEGPGVGRMVAEWMTDGAPEVDPHHSDVSRFYDYARASAHVNGRTTEAYNKTYGIVHPREQWLSNRPIRVSPFHRRQEELNAFFFETAGWERPNWYESNRSLLDEFGDQAIDRPHEWDRRWWSPIINAEHLAMRSRVGMVDLSAFALFDVVGPSALDVVQKLSVNQMDVPVGKAVYTPWLTPAAGFKSDLTIIRLGDNRFRIITGGMDGGRDRKWLTANLPEDGSASVHDRTLGLATIGVWGPRARDLMSTLTDDDLSNEGFPYGTYRHVVVDGVTAGLLRISYVGELGWEVYVQMPEALRVWDAVAKTGRDFGIVPMGIGVYGTTARLEKGYRLFGAELDGDYNPVEAGLARPKVKGSDFIGKEAYLGARESSPASILCTLTVDDHTSGSGMKRYMQGGEPILTSEGKAIVDSHGRGSFVTSAGAGPSVAKHLLMAYLPPELAVVGGNLAVEYMNERYPVTVEVAGSTPLFDPDDWRMKQ